MFHKIFIATTRDMLADLIEAVPMDERVVILLRTRGPETRYSFPAVMKSDGSEIEPSLGHWQGYGCGRRWVYSNPSPEEHRDYQIKRRARIARRVRRSAKRDFE